MEFKNLQESGIFDLLSNFGKEIFQPPGIIEWSGRAKKEAEINATLGVATGKLSEYLDSSSEKISIFHLSAIKNQFNNFTPDQIFPYAPIVGVPAVRDNWKKWICYKLRKRNTPIEPILTRPLITPGITMGVYVICKLFLAPGEKAVIPNKRWGNYDAIIKTNIGAGIKSFPLFLKNRFNYEGMKRAIIEVAKNQNKVFLLLNFPNNPTGYSPNLAITKKICVALKEASEESGKPLVVVTDDAYEGFVYDDSIRHSIFSHLAEINKNIFVVKIDGITKELLFWGGRLGMITFSIPPYFGNKEKIEAELENKVVALVRSTISNSTKVVQEGVAAIISEPDKFLKEQIGVISSVGKRALALKKEIEKNLCPDVTADPFNSGFFAFLNINNISAEKFADLLLKKYKIGVIPIENIKENINGIRVTFSSLTIEEIPKLVDGINKTADELK